MLSHATSIYDQPKQVCGVFLVFSPGQLLNLGNVSIQASFVSVQPCLKSAYNLLTTVSDGTESK